MIWALRISATFLVVAAIIFVLPESEGFRPEAIASISNLFSYAMQWNHIIPVTVIYSALVFTVVGQFAIFTWLATAWVIRLLMQAK